MPTICRCGHRSDSTDPHPCHGKEYTCRAPAKRRIVADKPGTGALAGTQLKLTGYATWACDACWKDFGNNN